MSLTPARSIKTHNEVKATSKYIAPARANASWVGVLRTNAQEGQCRRAYVPTSLFHQPTVQGLQAHASAVTIVDGDSKRQAGGEWQLKLSFRLLRGLLAGLGRERDEQVKMPRAHNPKASIMKHWLNRKNSGQNKVLPTAQTSFATTSASFHSAEKCSDASLDREAPSECASASGLCIMAVMPNQNVMKSASMQYAR